MGTSVKYLLVILNVCAALAVLPASAFVHRLYQSPAMNMYAELDRAGAIDWDRVASAFSEQARDDRGYLPRLFSGAIGPSAGWPFPASWGSLPTRC